jgi:hypothetical protein
MNEDSSISGSRTWRSRSPAATRGAQNWDAITSLIVDPQTHGANPFDRIADTLIIVN